MNNLGNSEDRPVLSILVISYNQIQYIAQTMDSLLSQEHDYSYEIVIGDDCSTDGTAELLAEYQKKYPEIIRLHVNEVNQGFLKNYYATLNRATGKYLGFCAGDDWWLQGKVALQVEYMEKNPEVGMVYSRALPLYENINGSDEYLGGPSTTLEELIKGNVIYYRDKVQEWVENRNAS